MNARLIGLAVIAALALTACGKRGTLERPPPLWGTQARADYDASEKKAKEEKEAKRKAEKESCDSGQQRDGPVGQNPITQPPDSHSATIAQDPIDGVPAGPDSGPGSPSNLIPH